MTAQKILFVRPSLGQGGADRVTIKILESIDRSRFQPELALMRREGVFLDDIPSDVTVHSLNAKNLWWTARPLAKLIRQNKYDFVYSTSTGTNIPVGIAKWVFRLPGQYILSERNSVTRAGSANSKQKFLNRFKQILYKRADWVTAVSDGIRRQLVDQFSIPDARTVVVNNPLIDDKLQAGKSETVEHPFFASKDGPVLLAAGRMVDAKNFPMLLRALVKVRERVPARLCVLGEGPKSGDLKNYAAELGLGEAVSFPGFDKNPYKYMAKCDVFILSSNFEGMPGVLVQALACGAACVATDCPTGPNELIESGRNGFLVPVDDEEATSMRILELIDNVELRSQFQSLAPESVARFETQKAIDSYFNFLQ